MSVAKQAKQVQIVAQVVAHQAQNTEPEKAAGKDKKDKIAVIRLRGNVTIKTEFEHTMQMLGLYKRNFCVVIPKNAAYLGMVEKVKDHVTWGEIDAAMLKELQDKRGQGKRFFRLNSPQGGLGRRGIKAPFSKAGSLGYRGNKINDLIRRML
ncbi:uL30 family ribosomal protein [Candidatus Woesearchaeota archaeon]|nr:uL30 family ribosomal protein [Candidatus Woesearchaeota archaeon]